MLASVVEIFSNRAAVISEPGPLDILCGKDKTYAKHGGNHVYREMIAAKCAMYSMATTKQAKMKVTKGIVGAMQQQHGSRFLRRSSSNPSQGWVEISDCAARDKTSHALRFCAKQQQQQQQQRHRGTAAVVAEPTTSMDRATIATRNGADSIFARQAEILHGMQHEHDAMAAVATLSHMQISSCSTNDNNAAFGRKQNAHSQDEFGRKQNTEGKETFDTLRSEDLHAILDEPLQENEWDTVMTLAG